MLRRVTDIIGFEIVAKDEETGKLDEAGKITDLYFEEENWTVRYAVVDTGGWLTGRKVLISPASFLPLVWEKKVIPVELTKRQIENSPDVDLAQTVSQQALAELHAYYGWPAYWAGSVPMGSAHAGAYTAPAAAQEYARGEGRAPVTRPEREEWQPHLHSAREVIGYGIRAEDGGIGNASDLFVEEESWIIRYLLVDTQPWWPGKHVIVSVDWVTGLDWAEGEFQVNVTKDKIRNSPEYDPREPISRRYEQDIHEYYGVPGYWMW